MNAPLLEAAKVRVRFPVRRNLLGRPTQHLLAVDGVDLAVYPRETVGLVGESGSGKSTLARALLRLVPIEAGRVTFSGTDLALASPAELRALRARMHLIFQDPYSSLDPSWTVEDLVAEPLDVHKQVSRSERRDQVVQALRHVGLDASHTQRYADEFSGGQRQRIAIARALIGRPDLVVCDEPVSALDVSTQSQVINLLEDLQEELGLTYLFIAHDLALVRHISDRIAVMYLGQVVEEGPAQRVYEQPAHPYTASLLSAIPSLDAARRQTRPRIILKGDIPSPLDPPSGCRFHTRCPFAMDTCRVIEPPVVAAEGGGSAACHLHVTGPELHGSSVLELVASNTGK